MRGLTDEDVRLLDTREVMIDIRIPCDGSGGTILRADHGADGPSCGACDSDGTHGARVTLVQFNALLMRERGLCPNCGSPDKPVHLCPGRSAMRSGRSKSQK